MDDYRLSVDWIYWWLGGYGRALVVAGPLSLLPLHFIRLYVLPCCVCVRESRVRMECRSIHGAYHNGVYLPVSFRSPLLPFLCAFLSVRLPASLATACFLPVRRFEMLGVPFGSRFLFRPLSVPLPLLRPPSRSPSLSCRHSLGLRPFFRLPLAEVSGLS